MLFKGLTTLRLTIDLAPDLCQLTSFTRLRHLAVAVLDRRLIDLSVIRYLHDLQVTP